MTDTKPRIEGRHRTDLIEFHDVEERVGRYLESVRDAESTNLTFVIKKNKSGIASFLYALTQGDDPLLRAYFFLRKDGKIVSCVAKASSQAGGAAGAVHGGLITSIVDQVCGISAFGSGIIGVTLTLSMSFKKLLPVDQWFEVTARIGQKEGRKLKVSCVVHEIGNEAKVFVEAESLFLQRDRDYVSEKVKSNL